MLHTHLAMQSIWKNLVDSQTFSVQCLSLLLKGGMQGKNGREEGSGPFVLQSNSSGSISVERDREDRDKEDKATEMFDVKTYLTTFLVTAVSDTYSAPLFRTK